MTNGTLEKLPTALDELAEAFCDVAIKITKLAGVMRGECNGWGNEDYECIDEDNAECNSCVLYAVPGKSFEVVDEDDAIEAMLKDHRITEFRYHKITKDLIVNYPVDVAIYTVQGHVIVEGPVYVRHLCGKDANLDEIKYKEAATYLATHATCRIENGNTADKVNGFFLVKEE